MGPLPPTGAPRRGIWFRLALRIIKQFGIARARMHHDTTTVTFHGQYRGSVTAPRLAHGHNKDYSGASNASEAAKRGVNLLAPAPAMGKPEPGKVYPVPEVDCPTGRTKAGAWLKNQEAHADFKERYAIRAGIGATNSELKRVQGLGKLRVRRGKRVKLAVYLKAAGCNLRRALRHWLLTRGMVMEAIPMPA